MAAWGNNFFKKIFFLLFFHFSAPLKCHWPIRASSLKSHSPAGRIYSPLATGRVLTKRLTAVNFCVVFYVQLKLSHKTLTCVGRKICFI